MRVYVLDDCEILRMSLSLVLQQEPDIEVCGDSGSGLDNLVQHVMRSGCTTLLIGLRLRNNCGLEITRRLRSANSNIVVIALGYSTDQANVQTMYQSGVDAFVSISSSNDEIVARTLSARRNGAVFDFSSTTSSDRISLHPLG